MGAHRRCVARAGSNGRCGCALLRTRRVQRVPEAAKPGFSAPGLTPIPSLGGMLPSLEARPRRWLIARARQIRSMKNSPYLVAVYLVIIVLGLLFALPNVLPSSVLDRWPSALPDKPVALGLDLRGGSHLVLEVDGTELRRERVRGLGEEARRLLRESDIPWRSVRAGYWNLGQPKRRRMRRSVFDMVCSTRRSLHDTALCGLTPAVSRAGVRSTEGTRKRGLWASA